MLGDKIKYLRKKHKITQQNMAQALDIARSTYTSYENNNRSPDYELLIKMADYFNVSTDFLLGRTERTNLEANETPDQSDHNKEASSYNFADVINHLIEVREISEEDYAYITKQVEDFISYAKNKKTK